MRWLLLLLASSALWWAVPPAHAAEAATKAPPGRVAFIGVPGLLWDDLDPDDTPHLWRLAGESGLGSVSVKAVGTVTCPYDGWLTVSAGVRSAVGHRCGLPPEPVARGGGAVVGELRELRERRDGTYAGTLGTAVHAAGQCTAAVGRGAALALADQDGKVDLYAPAPDGLADWSRCRVLAMDVDALVKPYLVDDRLPQDAEPIAPERRRALVREADAQVGAALDRLPPDTEILLAGIGDHGSVPHLRVAMWKRAGATGARAAGGAQGPVEGPSVGANSTRRDDITVLPDITPTVLAAAGIAPPPTVVGVPWRLGGPTTSDDLRRDDLKGTTVRGTTGVFFTAFAVVQVAFYALAYFLLSRRRRLGLVGTAAIVLAAVPVSTYAVNLLPWERSPYPVATLIGGVLAGTAAIAALALAGPWRRDPLGPPAAVAATTGAVLVGDLLTGTTLQFDSLMGYTAVVGGRYYGLANIPFALLATAVLMATAVAAEHLVRAGRRTAAVAVVAGLGVATMLLAGWPGVGSDFGGVIAFVPGIAVTALLVAGKRVSVLKLAGFCVLGGVAVSVIAVLDHLRPPASQTHLGRFVGQVIDGTFLPMIGRKLGAMLNTMLSPNLMPIVLAGLAFLVFAVLRPGQISAGIVPRAFARAPMLRAGLVGALVSGVVGMLVNDSGTAVLSMVVALAVPLVLHAGVRSPEPAASPVEERGRAGDVLAGET
ncbi:hypothetical protein FH608_014420 [Nonomuraea phyllanthi]|uniref:Uncharacterized protein n=1 Tax=Nonomuraea phyllanthi TaxID=2219224 RepID=A0A5C4WJU0_9ACTN|nr:hypothetical protein [Nonomuraea phyllanthi]KAB8194424.1 hypothetical protein FH608_014420 [Nonomuraea phyllanthi]